MGSANKSLALVFVAFFLISLVALPSTIVKAESSDDWAMFHHDPSHTGTASSNGPIKPNKLWNYSQEPYGVGLLSSDAAIVNGIVYAGSFSGNVYAFDAYTGNKLWSFSTNTSLQSAPAVVNNVLFIGIRREVYALNSLTGAKIWSFLTSGLLGSPNVVNGIVYVGSLDDNVYALNASTGTKIWNYTTGNYLGGHGVASSPAVHNGILYVGAGDQTFYALNASTGAVIWTCPNVAPYSSPAVSGGIVYFGSYQYVYALDALTGKQIWNFSVIRTLTGGIESSPAVANGVVYIGSPDGNFYALNASTGKKLWNYFTDDKIPSSPAVANGAVYVGSSATIYTFNASTGDVLWTYYTDNEVISSPAIANGILYIGAKDGSFYAIGESPQTNQSSPVIAVEVALAVVMIVIVSFLLFRRHRKTA